MKDLEEKEMVKINTKGEVHCDRGELAVKASFFDDRVDERPKKTEGT